MSCLGSGHIIGLGLSIHLGRESHGQLVLGKGPEEKWGETREIQDDTALRKPSPPPSGARQYQVHHRTRARVWLYHHSVDPTSIGRIAGVRCTAKWVVAKARGFDEPDAGGRWSTQLNYLYIQTPL